MEFADNKLTLPNDDFRTIPLEPAPFAITFSWKDNYTKIQLVNGDDVFELADIFSKMLTENNIEHKIIK
jgi:hypothetical protein